MNKGFYHYFSVVIILLMIGLASCNKVAVLEADEYLQYIQDPENGLLLEKKVGDIEYKLQYSSTEYMVINELGRNIIPQKLLADRKKGNDGMLFFKFKISSNNGGDILSLNSSSHDQTYERINYMSYGMEQDIMLVNNKDTIYPSLFHFSRTYGVVPYADFIFAFDSKIIDSDLQVLFDDKLFNSGLLKFNIDKDDLKNLPKLKTI